VVEVLFETPILYFITGEDEFPGGNCIVYRKVVTAVSTASVIELTIGVFIKYWVLSI
jgi:hypothetical protein